jgi:hypothetical protein
MELQMLHLRIVTQKLETGVEQSDSGFKNNMAHIKLRKHLNEIMEVNVMDSFVSKMVVAIKFIHDIALGR